MMRPLCLLLGLLLAGQGIAWSGTDVSGRYAGVSGNSVTIQLMVQPPPPAAFIVFQYLPAGVQLVSASPGPSSYQPQSGLAKWLFKHPGTGSTTIRMQLSQPVSGMLSGEIRFRPPGSDTMVSRPIQ